MSISILIRNRNVFLGLVVMVAALKLVLSAVAPASFDLRDIITLVGYGNAPIGPWIALYPPLYNQTASNLSRIELWPLSAPFTTDGGIAALSLMFRLPVFLFDLATMIVLFYIGKKMKSPVQGRLMGLVWFLNPYSLVGVELFGLPDVVCVFLVALSFLLIISKRPFLSAAALGLGAFIKLFPIFLLPPLLVYMYVSAASRRQLISAAVVGLLGLLGYLAWVLPGVYYLATYTPVTQLVPFIGGFTVNTATFGIISFYCLLFIFGKKANPLAGFISAFMVYYLVADWAPQYLLWVLPLIAIDLTFANRLKVFATISLYVLAFTQWFLFSSAFLTPSGYSLLMFPLGGTHLPSYSVALGKFLDGDLVRIIILPLVSSAIYACILVYAVEEIHSWFTYHENK